MIYINEFKFKIGEYIYCKYQGEYELGKIISFKKEYRRYWFQQYEVNTYLVKIVFDNEKIEYDEDELWK